ncbi:thioredoxin family protein [Candidatus Micrarchaeota archaeon]|nr:thioredoxin family protein [Candidatus Micrarchaeota archaeon]
MKVLFGLLVLSVLLLGCTQTQVSQEIVQEINSNNQNTDSIPSTTATVSEVMEKDTDPVTIDSINYQGRVLAGSTTKLLDFNKEDYNKAIASNKIVVLYFYANWCPICKAEFPKMQEAFNELNYENVVGFRVNYKDDETDSFETQLAQEFGVAYQHTKVFLKNGERIGKYPDSWNKERYLTEIGAVV